MPVGETSRLKPGDGPQQMTGSISICEETSELVNLRLAGAS